MNARFQLKGSLDQLESLSAAVSALQQSMHCTDKQLCEIILVLEELCSNAIIHGKCSSVEVSFSKEWDELEITITDDGLPFDPTAMPDVDIHQPLEQRTPGGLGIHLVHHYTDTFVYRREQGKNILTVTMVI